MLHLNDPDLALARLLALAGGPVPPEARPLAECAGHRLAEDLRLPAPVPAAATARVDGWAVAAADTAGAGPYAPAPLPGALWIESGALLPPGTDAVLEGFEATGTPPGLMAVAEVAPGDGLRPAAPPAEGGTLLRKRGERLRALDLPLLAAAGIAELPLRLVRVALLPVGDELAAEPARDALGPLLAHLVGTEGGLLVRQPPVRDEEEEIAQALRAAAAGADLVVATGGTGGGRRDRSIGGLRRAGKVALHGLGTRPGMTAAFGRVEGRAAVLLPGHPEDALAAWLLLARPALRHLAAAAPPAPRRARLARKLVSTVGLAEIALLGPPDDEGLSLPLAAGELPLLALAKAWAALVVPPASEGYEAGSWVEALDL